MGSDGATGGGAAATPAAVPDPDVAALWSRVGELERRIAELAEQKAELQREKAELQKENERLQKENAELRATAKAAEALVQDLRAQLKQNSSRPPSSDGPSVPRRVRQHRGRPGQRGGQPGHPGHHHALVPPEQVDERVDCYPEQCSNCQAALSPTECSEVGEVVITQAYEVEIRRRVRQYDQHRLVCSHCGASTLGALPPEAAHTRYGPSLTALVAVLSGVSQLARREVSRLCGELFGIPVSVGSVQKLCEQVSSAVAAPVAALGAAIRQQAVVGMDETSWRVQHKLRSLWVAWSAIGSVYKIGTRAAKVGQSLLGVDFAGCVMTDRYKGYDWIRRERRQLCWAHLDRDARALLDLGKAEAGYGKGIHRAAVAVFHAWRDFQEALEGPEARRALQAALAPVQETLRPLLLKGCRSRTRKVCNLCKAMEQRWDSLWLFCYQDGVEPTNNGSERRIRKGVQWRKKSLGTHSADGAAFVERMLTVTDTCRPQGRSPLAYLTEAAEALRAGTQAPSLLPEVPEPVAKDATDLRATTPPPQPTLSTAAAVDAPAPTQASEPCLDPILPPDPVGAPPTGAAPVPDPMQPAASADTAPTLDDIPTPAADRSADPGPEPATCPHIPAQPGSAAPPCARTSRGSTASRRGPNSTVARLVLPRVASP